MNHMNKISVKVIVDKVKERVVYAEADHTFVDILFSFMTLPLGTIVRFLGKNNGSKSFEALGSLNNLYQSLKDFPECYLATKECKSMLLNPRSLSYDHCRNLKLNIDDTKPIKYFACYRLSCSSFGKLMSRYDECYHSFTSRNCKTCNVLMGLKNGYWYSDVCVDGGVFVSNAATFIITDDLHVEPYTSATSFRLLSEFGITDMDHLEERNLDMSSDQVHWFLKMAFLTDCPLTYSVFPKTGLVKSEKDSSFHQCDLIKKDATPSYLKMLLEVSVQKSTGKILFAEAKEDFVEFVFGFLSIPLGTVIGTLVKGALSSSCMDNILKSISTMSLGRYLKSQVIKDMLLKPHIGQHYTSKHQIFPLEGVPIPLIERQHEDPRVDGGLLKRTGLFTVTDDLTISTPSSSFSTFEILKKLKVPIEDVERYEVSIGLEEGLSLLKASIRSCSALNTGLKDKLKK